MFLTETKSFYLRTLSVQGILDARSAGPDVLDLSNPMTLDIATSSLDRYDENAMLYQLLRVLAPADEDFARLRDEPFSLQDTLMFVDFGSIFLAKDEKLKEKARELLARGLDLRLKAGGDPVHFAAFDKSNSMARTGRISFLEKRLAEPMHRRLMLGMEGVNAILSKLYAYRGLYFSDGTRISLPLDEKSVVVLPDDETLIRDQKNQPRKASLFTAETHEKDEDQHDIWNCFVQEREVELNRFDGEGLIDPRTAMILNEQLGEESTSFQIRMPFAKGMLHTVNFQRFFRELQGEAEGKLWVRDVFDQWRDLSECRLLLTKSMFKGWKWLKTYCAERRLGDPMQYYFDQMREHDHALYISNTDAMLEDPTGRVPLNYQFLNPLALLEEPEQPEQQELTGLLNDHFRYADRLKKNLLYQRLALERTDLEAAEDGGTCADETLFRREKSAWIKAVKANPAFLRDSRVTTLLDSLRRKEQRNAVTGRLSVKGACRFLARDLLALMVFAAKEQICLDKKTPLSRVRPERFEEARAATLQTDRFYMPETTLGLWDGMDCALLRNPHLSRNEECALQACVPEQGSLYDRYFSHLTGVVMVGYNALEPMALGGADFDGDLVKVITDNRVVKAVRRGVYDARHRRVVPVVSIPSPAGEAKPVKRTVDVDTIANTFSSRVGSISNTAILLGTREYAAVPNEKTLGKCAECCLLTGLEIDASKTGCHPSLKAVNGLKNSLFPHGAQTYLKRKDKVLKLKIYGKDWWVESREESAFVLKARKQRESFRIARGTGTLDRLLYAYLEQVTERKPAPDEPPMSRKRPPLFVFQEQKSQPDPETADAVRAILEAYAAAVAEGEHLGRLRKSYQNAKLSGRCRTTLTLQYGSLDDPISRYFDLSGDETSTVEETLMLIWGKLEKRCAASEDAETLLRAMIDENWPCLPREQRTAFLSRHFPGLFSAAETAMLTRFDHGGYRLLYYMLKDVRDRRLQSEAALLADEPEQDEPEQDEPSSAPGAVSDAARKWLEEYRTVLRPLLAQKAEGSVWRRELIETCRGQLEKAMPGGTVAEAAEYLYVHCKDADPNRTIFWDVFRWSDLKDQICEHRKGASEPC